MEFDTNKITSVRKHPADDSMEHIEKFRSASANYNKGYRELEKAKKDYIEISLKESEKYSILRAFKRCEDKNVKNVLRDMKIICRYFNRCSKIDFFRSHFEKSIKEFEEIKKIFSSEQDEFIEEERKMII